MNAEALSESRVQLIRLVCFLFAASSFVLGAWMMLDPASAWGSMGVDVGQAPFVQALYGGAIMGEGAMFALGAIWPVRYLVFFQYLVIYKTLACLAGIGVLLRMDIAPIGGWLVIGGWASAGLISAIIFPWGQWKDVEAWYGAR
ncbi:MAG: hypothetical protein WCF10_15120 [Polyangiales bacterium]